MKIHVGSFKQCMSTKIVALLALTRGFVMCSTTGSEAVQEVETGNIAVPVLYKKVESEYFFCIQCPVLKAEEKY